MKKTSIYIHIPFCVKKCPYCDFNSYGVGELEPTLAEPYIEAICKELIYYFTHEWGDRELYSIFFGGGTPSLLSAKKLKSVIAVIREHTNFGSGIEVTLEANPGTVQEALGLEKLASLREIGFNRISFGSQSFSEKKLGFLGRLHSPDDIVSAVNNARRAGFKRLNLDLIFGLKEETLLDFKYDITETLSLSPEHISAYCLTIEPGTEFGKLEKRGLRLVESDEIQAELFEEAQKILSQNGFTQYEVSNYSKPKEECLHNLHYWQRGEYLGIGAGAHGFLSDDKNKWGRRWSNIPKPEHYTERVIQLGRGNHTREMLTVEQAELEFISLALRTRAGISIERYANLFDKDLVTDFADTIEWGGKFGLLEQIDRSVRVTKKGFIMVNSIMERFLKELR